MISISFGPLAQLVEQKAFNLCVIGSNPIRPTIDTKRVPEYRAVSSAGRAEGS